ncbi:DUF6807 family protein [Demequina globuliformis]|uniref:DUF6807 family protein n=1 Tax=Demequina globuliformis TaxID=676202 RepID=UPI000784F257|nr:DUF6807 family protein [Demequina globuliformis]
MPKVSPKRATATIGDVAEAAGVSRATVSRVMNGRVSVGAEISERVREVASQLQYRPSNVARSLSLGRTETVALVVPELANPMFQHVLAGMTEAAAHHGYRVLVADTGQNPDEEAAIAMEARMRCDALALVSPRMAHTQLAALLTQAAPAVLVNRDSPDPTTPAVTVNYRAGAAAVLTHLIGLGHTRIVYLAGPPLSTSDVRRRAGLKDALALHPQVELIDVAGGATVSDGYESRDAVLAARATAVVAFNDLVAFGLLAALNQAGVAVPGDISVTGFDDIELAQYSTPSLTTAAVPQHDLGRHAWQELHAVIENQDRYASTATEFEPRLVVRASSGPVPRTVAQGGLAPAAPETSESENAPAASAAPAIAPAPLRPQWRAQPGGAILELAGTRLAQYESGESIPEVHAPRPYLHPVYTLAGAAMTDSGPVDHRHHYGASMAVPDVNGTSYWGGRTFVRDVGPTLLHNHGSQVSDGARIDDVDPHVLHEVVHWRDEDGLPQAEESRTLSAHLLSDDAFAGERPGGAGAWALSWRTVLRADHGPLTIGSPATNGRPGAGYGGWFWRLPKADSTTVLSERGEGEERAHGSDSGWLAFVQSQDGVTSTWIAVQHGTPREWFVRAAEYPGAGPALAWQTPLSVPDGGTVEVAITTVLVDGAVTLERAHALAQEAAQLR